MKGKDGKSHWSPSDVLAKRLFMDSESQSENEQPAIKKSLKSPKTLPRNWSAVQKEPPSIKKTLKSPKTLPRRLSPIQNKVGKNYRKSSSIKKIKQYVSAKRISTSQKSLKQTTGNVSVNEAETIGSDDEVTFNFRVRSASISEMFVKGRAQNCRPKGSSKVVTTGDGPRKADEELMVAGVETSADLGDGQKAESFAVGMNQAKEAEKRNDNMKQKKRQRKKNKGQMDQKSKNAVTSDSKKPPKSEDIFFYCGNLPPGVTPETLRFFLNEEGINCKVKLKTLRHKMKLLRNMTAKQLKYKKNQKLAAEAVFATVIVKTEEDAKKMQSLDGVAMPSTAKLVCETNLKIIRRLPRPRKYPFKVHVGGLHPAVTEEDLKSYLENRGVKPGLLLIIRSLKSQKSKGFGFVWFESVPEADKAVDLPDPVLLDHKMVIEHSFKKKFKNF